MAGSEEYVVTGIEPVSGPGGRVRVHLEGANPAELSSELAASARLQAGMAISQHGLSQLLGEDERRRATDAAMRLLGCRPRS